MLSSMGSAVIIPRRNFRTNGVAAAFSICAAFHSADKSIRNSGKSVSKNTDADTIRRQARARTSVVKMKHENWPTAAVERH
jgi:hypothetical protein